MVAAAYVWRHGEYYDYGWFVPVAAGWLLWRRWRGLGEGRVVVWGTLGWLVLGVWVMWVLGLRVLGQADPSWRLPMGLLGVTAAILGHGLIAWVHGWRVSLQFGWLTLLWMSALPWPTVVELRLVRELTGSVVTVVADLFQLLGKPVQVVGDRLQLREVTVEVTDGCSGVRSFQSFVMATWFFAELQRLRVVQALWLLGWACVVAFGVNVARTFALAEIRFAWGAEAFGRAHDWLGLLAFGVSALVFFVISGRLSDSPRRRLVRTVRTR